MGIENSKQYIKGVNHAYLLAKHKPLLLENILKMESTNDYVTGLQEGKRIHEQEHTQSRLQELSKTKHKKLRDKGLER